MKINIRVLLLFKKKKKVEWKIFYTPFLGLMGIPLDLANFSSSS